MSNNPTFKDMDRSNLDGSERIMIERLRQKARVEIGGEGYDDRTDASLYGQGQLASAALCYIKLTLGRLFGYTEEQAIRFGYEQWPWKDSEFSYKPKDNIRNLERAGALIAAEIDRLIALEKENGNPITN